MNFGDVGTMNEVTVGNAGSGTINVTGTSTSAAWLTVARGQTDASGLGAYRIQVSRSGLANGTYNGWVEFRGSAGTAVRASVLMQVVSVPTVPSAGYHYVVLIDSASGDSLREVAVEARGASVNYTFTDVPPGTYELAAGTDINNNRYICDEGEACTEYPLVGEAAPIDATTADRTGLNMLTGFRSSPSAQTVSDGSPPAEKKGVRRP